MKESDQLKTNFIRYLDAMIKTSFPVLPTSNQSMPVSHSKSPLSHAEEQVLEASSMPVSHSKSPLSHAEEHVVEARTPSSKPERVAEADDNGPRGKCTCIRDPIEANRLIASTGNSRTRKMCFILAFCTVATVTSKAKVCIFHL